jgi:hypothetical protein
MCSVHWLYSCLLFCCLPQCGNCRDSTSNRPLPLPSRSFSRLSFICQPAIQRYILSREGVTLDGVLDWILDLWSTSTQLAVTLNYSAIADLHISQIAITHAKSFPARSVISSCLVTASNNGYSSASVLKSYLNGGSLPTEHSCNLPAAISHKTS